MSIFTEACASLARGARAAPRAWLPRCSATLAQVSPPRLVVDVPVPGPGHRTARTQNESAQSTRRFRKEPLRPRSLQDDCDPRRRGAGARHGRRRGPLSGPDDLRHALCRAAGRRRDADGHDARRREHSLQDQRRRREHQRADRQEEPRPHAPRRAGPAAQFDRRLRTVRSCRFARAHVLHAADHAGACARGRDRPHDPIDRRHHRRARSYRHGRARRFPHRRAEADGLRRHSRRRRRCPARRFADPSPRRRVGPGPERGQRHRSRSDRAAAGLRRRSRQQFGDALAST